MYWCHSCSNHNQFSEACLNCHSQAIEEVNTHNNPKCFSPYIIQERIDEPLHSLDSLYRSIYQNIFQAVSQTRPQAHRRVNANGNYDISYVIEDQTKGLSQAQIDKLTKKTVSSECSVCQQSRQSQGFLLECNHEFHEQCLIPWVKTNGSCPTCRHKLSSE